jgi:uncharacterized membrane protein YccC
MTFLQNPQQTAAAQQQALTNLPKALQILDSHTGDIQALKVVIAAIAAALSDNEAFKRELEQQLSKALPQPGQLVPHSQQPIVTHAKKTLRELLPPAQAALIRD